MGIQTRPFTLCSGPGTGVLQERNKYMRDIFRTAKKTSYHPAIGPLGDLGFVFRRLGGLSRLDIVMSMISVGFIAFWSCLRTGKRKAVNASMKPAVYLLTYIPADQFGDVTR